MTSNQPPYGDPQWPTETRYPDGTGVPDPTADPGGTGYSGGTAYVAGTGYPAQTDDSNTPNTGQSTKDAAAGQARDMKDHTAEAGRDVAQTAKSEAASVAADAKSEIRGLFDSSLSEVRNQAGTGQSRLAAGLRGLAGELGDMVQSSSQEGTATRAVQEIASYGGNAADWLENHEPNDVLDEVRRFAARRPVAFLAIAAGAGLVVGRFARGLQADRAEPDTLQQGYRTQTGQGYRESPPITGTSTDPTWSAGATATVQPRDPAYASGSSASVDPAYPTEGTVQGFSGQYGDGQFGGPGVQR